MATERASVTWQSRDALPEKEGDPLPGSPPRSAASLQELRAWCEARPDCVGFALRRQGAGPAAWGFHPKKRDTGFDAGTAKWNDRKFKGEEWEFHYIQERAGPQLDDDLPEFLGGTTGEWRLRKVVLDHGRDGEAAPRCGDTVEYRVSCIVVGGLEVPGVLEDVQRVTLCEGDACEALELGLQRMRPGERARLTAPWSLFAAAPPPPAGTAEAMLEGMAEAEVVVELLSMEVGPATTALRAIGRPEGAADAPSIEEAEVARRRQVGDLLDHARSIKEVGTRLFKGQRLLLALARYLQLVELLAILDFDAKMEQVPSTGTLGLTPAMFKERQQELKQLLGEEAASQARSLLLAARLNAALCWLQLREWAKAQGVCKQALAADASNIKALYRMAQAKMGLDAPEEARASLQELLKLEPDNAEAKKLLAEATKRCR